MNSARPSRRKQPAAFTCAACGTRRTFAAFGAGLGNELMERGEAAPICAGCSDRAMASGKARRRIERDIRRRSREPGGVPDRVATLDPEFCAYWDQV